MRVLRNVGKSVAECSAMLSCYENPLSKSNPGWKRLAGRCTLRTPLPIGADPNCPLVVSFIKIKKESKHGCLVGSERCRVLIRSNEDGLLLWESVPLRDETTLFVEVLLLVGTVRSAGFLWRVVPKMTTLAFRCAEGSRQPRFCNSLMDQNPVSVSEKALRGDPDHNSWGCRERAIFLRTSL